MERFSIAEEPKYTESGNSSEQIDLSLKLSLCGENAEEKILFKSSRVEEKAKSSSMVENGAEEGVCMDRSFSMPAEFEKGLVRFGDLQTMRRVRSRKRLLLEKMRRTAASEAAKFLAVSPRPPPAGAQPLPHSIHELKALSSPCGDSWFEGGGGSNIQTSHKQENNCMVSPREKLVRPSNTKLMSPAKKLKHGMDILRQMPSVTTTGNGPTGKRIEGLLYKYKRGQVCIGNLLSPREFVVHAGGKEVADPMKHITICSDSFYINGDGAGFITHPF